MDTFLITIITLGLLIVNFTLFILVISFERKRRIDKLLKNLSLFSPNNLANKLESYSSTVKKNREIAEIEEKIRQLKLVEFKRIQNMLKDLGKFTLPVNFYKFYGFTITYKRTVKKMKNYEKEYLDYRFDLFDLTLDVEIEKTVLDQLRKRTNKVKEAVYNSPLGKIRDSKKINNKILRLLSNLKKLEFMIDEQIKHLSIEFIEIVKKISNDIETIMNDVNFMNLQIKHIEDELQVPLKKIVNSYNENQKLLIELSGDVNKSVAEIKKLKKEIREDIIELKHKKVNENIIKLDDNIARLNWLIHSNIEYAFFNKEYENIPDNLLKFVRENNGLFISEIKRHHIEDEKNRLLLVGSALQNFEISYTKYEREKLNQFSKYSPQGIASLLLDIFREYKEYIRIVKENVVDISLVNESTNEINNDIATMNTSLLQIEYNLSKLHGTLRENYSKQKEYIQEKVLKLKSTFKNNTKKIDKETFKETFKLNEEINELVDLTKASAFEIFFIKETIMFLNKHKGNDSKYDLLLDSINKSYNEEKFSDALRKSKEIIEIYNVK